MISDEKKKKKKQPLIVALLFATFCTYGHEHGIIELFPPLEAKGSKDLHDNNY